MRLAFPGGEIRPWRRDDAATLAAIADNRAIWINLTDRFPHPYRPSDARQWILEASGRDPPADFAIDCGGAVGGIGLLPGTGMRALTAEIGYWLGEPWWGRGIATAAVGAMTRHAFASLGCRRVFARVLEWNPASMRVLEKNGYRQEARLRKSALKDGKVVDELLYARVDES